MTNPAARTLLPLLLCTVAGPALAQEPVAATSPPGGSSALTQVARFQHQVTRRDRGAGRPDLRELPALDRGFPGLGGGAEGRKPVPYPDGEWNSWRNARKDAVDPKTHFVCVQSVVADKQGRLWVVDAAAPAMAAVVKDGPKLVAIDLKTNAVAKTIAFDHRWPRRDPT